MRTISAKVSDELYDFIDDHYQDLGYASKNDFFKGLLNAYLLSLNGLQDYLSSKNESKPPITEKTEGEEC